MSKDGVECEFRTCLQAEACFSVTLAQTMEATPTETPEMDYIPNVTS